MELVLLELVLLEAVERGSREPWRYSQKQQGLGW